MIRTWHFTKGSNYVVYVFVLCTDTQKHTRTHLFAMSSAKSADMKSSPVELVWAGHFSKVIITKHIPKHHTLSNLTRPDELS